MIPLRDKVLLWFLDGRERPLGQVSDEHREVSNTIYKVFDYLVKTKSTVELLLFSVFVILLWFYSVNLVSRRWLLTREYCHNSYWEVCDVLGPLFQGQKVVFLRT